MNRRIFLASLLSPFVIDPERLLWVKGKKVISIPKQQAAILQSALDAYYDKVKIEPIFVPRAWETVGDTVVLRFHPACFQRVDTPPEFCNVIHTVRIAT